MIAEPNHCFATRWVARNFESSFSGTLDSHHIHSAQTQTDTRLPRLTPSSTAPCSGHKAQPWRLESGVRHVLWVCARDGRPGLLPSEMKADAGATDDEEEDSTPPASPVNKPIARRSKFDDEEDDSDVRQPTIPRAAQLWPRHA